MGSKRDYQKNALFGWLMKLSIKVKIILGTLLFLCALVALNSTFKEHTYFFLASEAVDLSGTIVLLYKLFTKKTCSGLSLKTQELTALHLALRLINITKGPNIYAVLYLISLLSTFLIIWMIRFKLKSSYIKELDNMPISFVVVPCAILAVVIHPRMRQLMPSILWAFCAYLGAVTVLPQVRFLQNAKMIETFTGYYVFALGVSRLFALAHWIIQIYRTREAYLLLISNGHLWFITAIIAELVESFILIEFCYYYIKSFKQGQLLRKMPV